MSDKSTVSSAIDAIKPNARASATVKKAESTPRGRRAVATERSVASRKAPPAATTPAPAATTAPAATGAATKGAEAKAKRVYKRNPNAAPRAPKTPGGFNTSAVRKELTTQRSAAAKAIKDQEKAYKTESKTLNAELNSVSKKLEQLEKTNDRVLKGANAAIAQADKLLAALA